MPGTPNGADFPPFPGLVALEVFATSWDFCTGSFAPFPGRAVKKEIPDRRKLPGILIAGDLWAVHYAEGEVARYDGKKQSDANFHRSNSVIRFSAAFFFSSEIL